MKSSSLLKIILFLLLTAVFVTGLIAYSKSRGHTQESQESNYSENVFSNDEVNRRYEKQFIVKEGGEIIVEADAGTITIDSWEKNEVNIIVEIDGSDSRAEKYNVEFKQEGDKVYVTGKVKDKSFFKWHVGDLEAKYTIYTPKNFNSTVKTSGGNVKANNLVGKTDYTTSGGDIVVNNIEGQTLVSTSGGNIDVTNIRGEVDAETSGGNVFIENITGSVKGYTSGGNVELLAIDGRVKGGTSGGDVTVKLIGENKGVDVETSGGDINIFLKNGVSADVDVETSGGSVDCDFPVTVRGKVRDSELHGKINGGGNSIRANTSGGSIRISELK